MQIKPFQFWYDPTRPPTFLYRAGAFLYGMLRRLHVAMTRPTRPKIPTICVGNVTVGGAGKTPVVRALRAMLPNHPSVVLLRGYGARARGPTLVTADDPPCVVGDESLIHALDGITVIARNRLDGMRMIERDIPDARWVIMDDGLQNRHIVPTMNIMVVDGAVGFGNGYMIPAGPLREPLSSALSRTDVVVVMGDDQTGAHAAMMVHTPQMPVFTAHLVPDVTLIDRTRRYVAFAGIGRPQKFYDTLRGLDLTVVDTRDFPDHYVYQKPDVTALFDRAREHHATLITTEKDAVKIRALTDRAFAVLPVRAVFDDPAGIQTEILARLK